MFPLLKKDHLVIPYFVTLLIYSLIIYIIDIEEETNTKKSNIVSTNKLLVNVGVIDVIVSFIKKYKLLLISVSYLGN